MLENYGDTIILIFPYDIVICSGFKIYIYKEVDFCLIFSIWESSSWLGFIFSFITIIGVEVYKFGVSGWCAAVS